MGLAWYNCDLGFELFETQFGDDDNFAASGEAFWPVVGSISGLIFVLTIYCKFVQKKPSHVEKTSPLKEVEATAPQEDLKSDSLDM